MRLNGRGGIFYSPILALAQPFLILQSIDLSIGYVAYLNTTYHLEKDSWQSVYVCGFQSHITAKYAGHEDLRLGRL